MHINKGCISNIVTKLSCSGLKESAVFRWLTSCFPQERPHIHRSCSCLCAITNVLLSAMLPQFFLNRVIRQIPLRR